MLSCNYDYLIIIDQIQKVDLCLKERKDYFDSVTTRVDVA